jgi:hypothetical protein
MASQSRKYRGFSTERVVARYLSEWWPHADSPQDYLAFMRLGDLVDLLLKSGYGDFTGDLATLEPQRCKMCGAWAFTPLCRTCEVDPDANL